MSLVTGGLGGSSSSSVVKFDIKILKINFKTKKHKKTFDKNIIKINFKIKEVEK